ncbi:MAG TPA: tripartite tricarboxylate transporter substrate binding protein [Gammaproteobacteria bacterium]
MRSLRTVWRFVLAAFAVGLFAAPALSQERFPDKPITLITPFAAGGSSDLTARVVTTYLHQYLGQPMLIRLVPGQAGQKGTLEATQAAPDGYTLVYTDNFRDQLHQFTFRNNYYDTNRDLVSVARVNYGQIGVIVTTDGPYQTWADLEADARARPGEVRLSHSGLWAALFMPAQHMMIELGLRFRMVPYRGGGPAKAALMAGDVEFSMAFPSTIAADLEANTLRLLATAGPQRLIEDVPSFVEIGLPATTGYIHRIVMAPRGIPDDRLTILRAAFAQLQEDEQYLAAMHRLGENTEYLDGADYEQVRLEQQRDYRELVDAIAGL